MKQKRPRVFIGSSTEGLAIAKAIQLNLDHVATPVIWSQGVFGLTTGTLEALTDQLEEYDFAILVLTADDLIKSRHEQSQAPRDNVLLELGIFLGYLGRQRTYIVYDRTADLRLPSDLAGVTAATYHHDENLSAALGPACTTIESTMKKLGCAVNRRSTPPSSPTQQSESVVAALPKLQVEYGQLILNGLQVVKYLARFVAGGVECREAAWALQEHYNNLTTAELDYKIARSIVGFFGSLNLVEFDTPTVVQGSHPPETNVKPTSLLGEVLLILADMDVPRITGSA